MGSSSEEYEQCSYCGGEIENEEEKADNSCGCVIHIDCLQKSVKEIICPCCEPPECQLEACAEKRAENEALKAEIKRLKQHVDELTKQLGH